MRENLICRVRDAPFQSVNAEVNQWRIYIVKFWTRAPQGPNPFNFMQFLVKFGKIVCWRPPGELAPPPRGNPGSATVNGHNITTQWC